MYLTKRSTPPLSLFASPVALCVNTKFIMEQHKRPALCGTGFNVRLWCNKDPCPTYGAIRVVCLILEAVLFGLFTMCMMCDQYSVITTGTTQIDRLKGEIRENLGLQEVFGGANTKFAMHWLLPVNIWFPSSVKHQVLGYVMEHELNLSEDDSSEMDTLMNDDSASDTATTMTTETLEGGWSVEKRLRFFDCLRSSCQKLPRIVCSSAKKYLRYLHDGSILRFDCPSYMCSMAAILLNCVSESEQGYLTKDAGSKTVAARLNC
ncbi:hypothetical protein PsorP6_002186 [Peronosclerospora sorghi]|uniref:Uncharacterized protein n=1 Tax=Peronosclerospora sorghi TaxID=230839 RepID=A0ACC0WUT2_9STRA|nr:hypothetical protein PsorP6_002186 [Peronosclerospora sorghi]